MTIKNAKCVSNSHFLCWKCPKTFRLLYTYDVVEENKIKFNLEWKMYGSDRAWQRRLKIAAIFSVTHQPRLLMRFQTDDARCWRKFPGFDIEIISTFMKWCWWAVSWVAASKFCHHKSIIQARCEIFFLLTVSINFHFNKILWR